LKGGVSRNFQIFAPLDFIAEITNNSIMQLKISPLPPSLGKSRARAEPEEPVIDNKENGGRSQNRTGDTRIFSPPFLGTFFNDLYAYCLLMMQSAVLLETVNDNKHQGETRYHGKSKKTTERKRNRENFQA
jgi:hypothetical protein